MKKKIIQPLVIAILLLVQTVVNAQTEVNKLQESFDVEKDVFIDLNTKRTHVVFETWNRDEVKIEAKVFSDELAKEQLQKIAELWKLEILGNSHKIAIASNGIEAGFGSFPEMGNPITVMNLNSDMIAPFMKNMVGPMLKQMSNHPLPPEFAEGLSSLKFDYDAYQKEGEAYVERYEQEVEDKFGKNFEAVMQEWGGSFEKDAQVWAKQLERKMQAMERSGEMKKREEAVEKKMEEWSQNFTQQIEAWAQQFEGSQGNMTKTVTTTPNGKIVSMQYSGGNRMPMPSVRNAEEKVRRTIVIKMPKNAKVHLNVRHGNLTFEDDVTNLRGNIAHTNFKAKNINGKETALTISYSPIYIEGWEHGSINTSYVKDCKIEKAKSIKLSSNASDVVIDELEETGIISGSFGELTINHTGDHFKRLEINLENSDLILKLPSSSFNFTYSGSRSEVKYPSKLKTSVMDSYGNQLIDGYHKSRNTDSSIRINARFSDVLIQ
ncbi:hypothetical protein [Mesonia aestuariivivens]|uniref:Adhesin domain-containing protein n=1 Tax=Mesonia aestuariivivens TaxID=2796128 RepID=A0ABS6W407_9FLAO|nr:hypothetical protein [Mesonia aestuariivivens]MBW2962598.1 hypothetical protein [Mesonia aestuariivivens]